MGIKIERKKPRHLLASLFYRFLKLPLSDRTKFKLFLDLEWIFNRLSNEQSHKFYSADKHPWRNQAFQFIEKRIERNHVVLDLGCGYGEIASMISSEASVIVGVDHDKTKIYEAQRNYTKANLTFLCMDAIEYLQTTDLNFDVLVLSHVLEHIDEPVEFLKRFRKYFQYIYIEVPDFDATVLNHYRVDLDLILKHTDNDHVTEFDRDELQELFRQCDLAVIHSQHIFGIQRYWCEVR